jgi:hypothetical protein
LTSADYKKILEARVHHVSAVLSDGLVPVTDSLQVVSGCDWTREGCHLDSIVVLCYLDLKKYAIHYVAGFPAWRPPRLDLISVQPFQTEALPCYPDVQVILACG